MNGRLALVLANGATPAPRSVRLAFRATLAWAGCTVLSAIVLFGYRSYVYDSLIKSNTKAKNPKSNYTGSVVDHDVSRVLTSGVITGLLSAVSLVLLAFMLIRARPVGRWGLMAMATVLPVIIPFGVGVLVQLLGGLFISGAPALYRVFVLAAGLAALAVLVLLVVPETSNFFAANRPDRPARASRPSLFGGLAAFGNKSARSGSAARASGDVVDVDASSTSTSTAASTSTGPGEGADPLSAPVARPRVRKDTSTRPGSVKPKGAGSGRGGRAKSRNQ